MKVKLFVYSSLGLLGVWLAAAYMHNVDLSSYQPQDDYAASEKPAETVVKTEESNEGSSAILASQ